MLETINKADGQQRLLDSERELESQYFADLDSVLRDLCKQRNATLASVLRDALGAFPSTVVNRLKVLGLHESLSQGDATSVRAAQSTISPELHPLDFEWYFTDRCARMVGDLLSSYGDEVLCLGAPTVAMATARAGKKAYLADRNPLFGLRFPEGGRLVKFVVWDLNEPLPLHHTFPVVFFDAPWYVESIRLWLWQASRIVKDGGIIIFSMFPRLLRPGADYERHYIYQQAETIGAVIVKPALLEYQTPLFEREALVSAGISYGESWRHSDLIIVTNVRGALSPVPSAPSGIEQWETFVIGEQVVKLRYCVRGISQSILEPIGDSADYIYPTVSLRDPSRGQVDLWTSRNRVARVSQRGIVHDVLRHLSDGTIDCQRISELPVLSLLGTEEKALFVSDLRLILDSPREETNVSFDNCAEVLRL